MVKLLLLILTGVEISISIYKFIIKLLEIIVMTSMNFPTLPHDHVTNSFLLEIWFWSPTYTTFLYDVTLLNFFKSSLRHKKSLTQMTPTNTRKPSNEEIISDIFNENMDENIPEELRLTHEQVDMYLKISGNVDGMDCILVDDMIDTGSTIRLALEVLHSHNAGYVHKT